MLLVVVWVLHLWVRVFLSQCLYSELLLLGSRDQAVGVSSGSRPVCHTRQIIFWPPQPTVASRLWRWLYSRAEFQMPLPYRTPLELL